jgi:biotin carboxyl carrier protein
MDQRLCLLQVLVANGDVIEEGTPLIVMEAMKMEHMIRAPCTGVISSLSIFPGEQLEDGMLLLTVEQVEKVD